MPFVTLNEFMTEILGPDWEVITQREIDSLCADPNAPIIPCCFCGKDVHTCELEEPIGDSYICPVHTDGSQLDDDRWVCSYDCYTEMVPLEY